jgi:HEAT repeat protein
LELDVIPNRLQSLEADLDSADEFVRLKALTELSESTHDEALAILWRACEKADLQEAGAEAFKSAVIAHPRTALRHTDQAIRVESLRLSGKHQNISAVDEISRMIRNESSPDMREKAASTLGEISDPSGVAGLQHGTLDQVLRVREAVLKSLTKITHTTSEEVVVDFLVDVDWSLRQRARDYLENSGWSPDNRRENTSWAIAQGRFDEAVKNGAEAVEPLLNTAVYVNDSEVRHWASVALARLSTAEVVNRLHTISETTTTTPTARAAALDCLRMMGQPVKSTVVQKTAPHQELSIKPAKRKPLSVFDAAIKMLALIGEP